MLKNIIFLTPMYMSLFWMSILASKKKKKMTPHYALSFFMFLTFLVYLGHFLYFLSFKNTYAWFDPIYQWASLSVYPAYYIYIRLLTVDNTFSAKKHLKIFVITTFFLIIYLIGVAISPWEEYKIWLFDRNMNSETFGIQFLKITFQIIKIVFLITTSITVHEDIRLLSKYKNKTLQCYSKVEHGDRKIRTINFLTFLAALSSIILASLEREFFTTSTTLIVIASTVFSFFIFSVGYLGNQQQALNSVFQPYFSDVENFEYKNDVELFNKIINAFEKEKCYLNPNLTIVDVAQKTGSNRTYISKLINNNTKQDFRHFTNEYRVRELEEILKDRKQDKSLKELAFQCGFGSIDSMKRAVKKKTNQNFHKWREQISRN